MNGNPNFTNLNVWQKAKELAVYIYKVTDRGGLSKDYSLKDQLRRASVSIASNIAEGDERGTNKEAIRFFYMARGSAAEIRTQTIIAHAVGYIDEEVKQHMENEAADISKMLYRLIEARSSTK